MNRRNRNYNDFECGIFVREPRNNNYSYRNNDYGYYNDYDNTSGSHFFEIIGLIVGVALLIVAFS